MQTQAVPSLRFRDRPQRTSAYIFFVRKDICLTTEMLSYKKMIHRMIVDMFDMKVSDFCDRQVLYFTCFLFGT